MAVHYDYDGWSQLRPERRDPWWREPLVLPGYGVVQEWPEETLTP